MRQAGNLCIAVHRKCYANIADFSTSEVGNYAPLSEKWYPFRRIGAKLDIMVRHTDTGISYAPLYIHSFPLVQPHFLVDAEKFNLAYSDLSKIDNTADRLRWCRYHKGLLQRDVADYTGIDRGTYWSYEETTRNLYPLDKMEKIAELYGVSITELLDEYNTFLYIGQGKQLKSLRKNEGLTQKEYAILLGIPFGTLKNWEADRVQMFKSTWEQLFRNELVKLPCDRTT